MKVPGRSMPHGYLTILLGVAGCALCLIAALALRLPTRIDIGRRGQTAIQALDAMRRPFLDTEQSVADLLASPMPMATQPALAQAAHLAEVELGHYQARTRYNPALQVHVTRLTQALARWKASNGALAAAILAARTGGTPGPWLDAQSTATRDFLDVMARLGDGEAPIHRDIADGWTAGLTLTAMLLALLAYLVVLAFLAQLARSRQERALLHDKLAAEARAHSLERDLSVALSKALSGFIPICANCKGIRVAPETWVSIEEFVAARTDAQLTHGICPMCAVEVYGMPPRGTRQG